MHNTRGCRENEIIIAREPLIYRAKSLEEYKEMRTIQFKYLIYDSIIFVIVAFFILTLIYRLFAKLIRGSNA